MSVPELAWPPGHVVPIRHVQQGKVWFAMAATVVSDTPELLALHVPLGAGMQWGRVDWATGIIEEPKPTRWTTTETLRLFPAGARHIVTLMWRGGSGYGAGGEFLCWYVDLAEPWRKAGGGVVTFDRSLDIVIGPDRRWRWKDEDHFGWIQDFGWITAQEAEVLREEGERVIARAQAGEPPFDDAWLSWTPDPAWPTPELPQDWARVP